MVENSGDVFGVVKVYYPLKGYGFITRDIGREIFFHRKDVLKEANIVDGGRVKFRVLHKGNEKARAVDVKCLD